MLVSYYGEGEVLVCTGATEARLIKEFFVDGGRDLECYYREETEYCVEVSAKVSAWVNPK